MSYFTDLTPHIYTPTGDQAVLNVGWLDVEFPYLQGVAPPEFLRELQQLCERPIHLHRGFHVCQFCAAQPYTPESIHRGNGQIRVEGQGGIFYAAPTMVYHYVMAHSYSPPPEFVAAVLRTDARSRR
jgi:hypothetical protein